MALLLALLLAVPLSYEDVSLCLAGQVYCQDNETANFGNGCLLIK